MHDVVIVGDGSLGTFLAAELARRSMRAVVVAPVGRRGAASRAAGFMLGHFGEVTKDTFTSELGKAKFAMAAAAHRLWPETIADLAAEADEELHVVKDTHVILNGCGSTMDEENYDAILRALSEHGGSWDEVDPAGIAGYRPRPDGRALRALRINGEGALDGNQVLRLMDERLARLKVDRVLGTVRELVCSSSRVTGVRTDEGELIEAPIVVVAAGVPSAELLNAALGPASIQPMFAGTGTAVVTRREGGAGFDTVVRTPNRGGACGLHAVPLANGHRYFGASNLLKLEARDTSTTGTTLAVLQQLGQQLDEYSMGDEIQEWRTGNRPVTLDGFPLVGWTSVTGLYALTGTYRDGFHAAPALAQHVAAEIAGDDPVLDLPFAPERAPAVSWTVEQSIEEYAAHMTSLWFELGGRAPGTHPTALVAAGYRDEARRFYRSSGIGFGLNPDILCFLASSPDKLRFRPLLRYIRSITEPGADR